ncbi:MAG TPA: glycoside hydrolase family 9 protein [Verrucomicrobiota bacterium]|nr:glycoside hydrolase family 9 protein [Verrucomicrobiota bacterium]
MTRRFLTRRSAGAAVCSPGLSALIRECAGAETSAVARPADPLRCAALCLLASSFWLAPPWGVQADPGGSPDGADLIDVAVVSDRILWLEFNDGWVKHSGYHEPRNRCVVHRWPLDLPAAAQTANYTLRSDDDPDFGGGRHPTDIGRKSKGSDFAGGSGEVVNNHYLYLFFSQPLKPGKSYELSVGNLAGNLKTWPIRYDFRSTRSEAVHVNQLGYAPRAPVKVGYLSQWMGDRGPLDLAALEGRPFHLVAARGSDVAFSGKVKRRTPRTHIDSAVPKDVPHQNWSNADVCECDFSSFGQPGEYVLAVEGLGCSYPFRISEDVYRDAFYVTCRGLYHHRAGIELKRPYTSWERKADTHEGHISHPVWGWYHDAGDWDGYGSHSIVPRYLLLAFELAPRNFSDGELNLPESGNGLPDLLDEAAWLIHYYRRSRAVFDGGVTGGRVDGDAEGDFPEQNGYPSYEDSRKWVVQGATAEMTYGYAGLAANLAYCCRQISSQTQQLEAAIADWTREARSAYAWAEAHDGPIEAKAYASAWLYKLTGEEAFHLKFKEANAVKSADQTIGSSWNGGWSTWACFAYATLPHGAGDPELKQAIKGAVLKAADAYVLEPARRHTYRVGRDPHLPSFLGKLTTPVPHEAMLAHALTGKPDYLAAVFTTADFFLGGNPLNMTWVTGLGQRCPREVLNLDAWALEYRDFQPGIVPYGPSTQDFMHPNSVYAAFWAYDRLYPAKDSWPLAEMWCDNRYAVASGEYTVWQNIAPAAATYAYLCAATRHGSPNGPPSIQISSNPGPVQPRHTVTLRVEAKDPDGWIQRVDYYANKRMIGHATEPPFSCDWQPTAEGEFTIEARARDNHGARSYSQPVRIRVQATAAAGKPSSPQSR